MGTLTVRENLEFSANLRLDKTVTKEERKIRVQDVINELGLNLCADTKVGFPLLYLSRELIEQVKCVQWLTKSWLFCLETRFQYFYCMMKYIINNLIIIFFDVSQRLSKSRRNIYPFKFMLLHKENIKVHQSKNKSVVEDSNLGHGTCYFTAQVQLRKYWKNCFSHRIIWNKEDAMYFSFFLIHNGRFVLRRTKH